MPKIYKPKGAAREYSPLALNHYKGCDYGCSYCYVPKMMKRFNANYDHSKASFPNPEKALKEIRTSAKKHRNSPEQVMLSFTHDPYTTLNDELQITRQVLQILLENQIPVSILSKGGSKLLPDFDVFAMFQNNIQVGMTLTHIDEHDRYLWEEYTPSYIDRKATLQALYDAGIRTWVSLEPIINPPETLQIIEDTHKFVHHYKIGKLNYCSEHEKKVLWTNVLNEIVIKLRVLKKPFYIKNALAKYKHSDLHFRGDERNADYFALTNTF
jgi:DNA repair photolyase